MKLNRIVRSYLTRIRSILTDDLLSIRNANTYYIIFLTFKIIFSMRFLALHLPKPIQTRSSFSSLSMEIMAVVASKFALILWKKVNDIKSAWSANSF